MTRNLTISELLNQLYVECEEEQGWRIPGWFCVVFKDGDKYALNDYIRDVSNAHSINMTIYSEGLPVVCSFRHAKKADDVLKKVREGMQDLNSISF